MRITQLRARLTVGASALFALALFAAAPNARAQSVEQMLSRAPIIPDVEIDVPSEAEAAQCVVKSLREGNATGAGLYKADGTTLLRAWIAGPPKQSGHKSGPVEQLRFYKNGVEVFREQIGKEARWLNTGGSRRGRLGADKKTIAEWTSLSPQEATQEVVAALKTNDFARYQRVAVTANDLEALGVSGAIATELNKEVQGASQAAFAKLAQTLKIPADANWGALNAGQPAEIPAGADFAKDLDVYYNVAVVVIRGSEDAAQSQEIFIGDLVKIGDVWKVVGLPSGEPFGEATGAVSASSVLISTSGDAAVAQGSADVGELGNALSEAYRKLETASPNEYPALCEQTVNLLLNIAESNPQERDNMLSQAIDVVFGGVQSGVYPDGAKKLAELGETLSDASPEVKARLRQRQITADYYAVSQRQPQPNARELSKAQEKYSEDLAAFVEEYSTTTAAAEAAMTLALDQEYMLENETAIKYYQQVAQNAAKTAIGQKAAGAVARLQAEGGVLKMPNAQYFGGGACDLDAMKGKPTVIFFWGSWDAESVNAVKKIANQVNVVGVNVDSVPDPANANAYYQQILKGIPWKNVCDPKGLDGALPVALGVQTAPWVVLIDKDGKCVRSNIANLEELPDVVNEMK